MKGKKVFTLIPALLVAGLVLFKVSPDFRWYTCQVGAGGYFDFSSDIKLASIKCVAEASHEMLLRDFPVTGKSRSPVHSVVSNNISWETVARESQGFTIPFAVKGLIKDNPCTRWTFEYAKSTGASLNTSFTPLLLSTLEHRSAFGLNGDAVNKLTVNETFDRIMRQEPLFISFDNDFLGKENPVLLKELNLEGIFPGQEFFLNTLFMSNFERPVLASSYHAAAQNNNFFTCRGKKHWYFYAPQYLKYTSAYMSRNVMWTSNEMDKYSKDVFERLPGTDIVLEPGDMLYVPPFWLHAVATSQGESIAIANRFHDKVRGYWVPFYNSPYFKTMQVLHFPYFLGSFVAGKIFNANKGRTIFDWAVPPKERTARGGADFVHIFEPSK